jgi:two-component system CheB/CheR fusion protein
LGEKIFEVAEVGICITDAAGYYIRVNPAYCTIYGYRPEALIGHHFSVVVPPEHQDELSRVHDRFIDGEEELSAEWTVCRKDGQKINIFATAARLIDQTGERFKITTVVDITPLKEARQELSRLNRKLEIQAATELTKRLKSEQALLTQSRVAAMGEMISAVAHHWRQPLTAVGVMIQSLQDEHENGVLSPDSMNQTVRACMDQITDMSKTIDYLRGMVKHSSHQERCCALEEIQVVGRLLRASLQENRIAITVSLFDQAPLPLEEATCPPSMAHRVQLIRADFRQCLFNIFNNARDGILQRRQKDGQPQKGRIHIALSIQNGMEQIAIEDNGAGFEPRIEERLFEPFFTTKERGRGRGIISGTGLGLYISKLLIEERMEGRIRAEGLPTGARFIIDLPLAHPAQAPQTAPQIPARPKEAQPLSLEGIGEMIFAATEVGICVTDAHHRYVRVNQAYCDIYGYQPEELIGQPFTLVVPAAWHEALKKLHDDFLAGKEEIATEWSVRRKDGRMITIYATASRLTGLKDGPYKLTTVQDVTAMKALEKKHEQQQALLVQQSKLAQLGDMLGAIAHQWKQPLNGIALGAQNIQEMIAFGDIDIADLKATTERILKQTAFMQRTADDFIHFYRPTEASHFNPMEAIARTLELFKGQFDAHLIKATLQGAKNATIAGREGEFKQVILSLLANAQEAIIGQTQEGGRITIVLDTPEPRWLHIKVCDTGGGIPKALLPDKIFERFCTTKPKGSGVGLMLAKTLIEEGLKGQIKASNTHEGACILIWLPMAQK